MSPSPTRLQIAARMHELLLAEIGFGIEVERLLTRERYARDVLLVCDACTGSELPQLAAQFRRLTPSTAEPATAGAAPGHAAQPTEWSRDTSGFGVTGPQPLPPTAPAPAPAAAGGWRSHLPWR